MTSRGTTERRRAAEAFAARARTALGEGIETIRLFGSVARGEATDESDVDLFVTPRDSERATRLRELAYEVELAFAVPISLIIESSLDSDHPFVAHVRETGVPLDG